MTLISLDIPPGIVKDDAEYRSRGRWRDGTLVRWQNGVLQPWGPLQIVDFTPWGGRLGCSNNGLKSFVNVGTFAIGGTIMRPRTSAMGSDAFMIFVGTNTTLHQIEDNGDANQITTAGLTSGSFSGSADGSTESDYWSMGVFGDYLIFCLTSDGTIWEYDTTGSGIGASAVSGAPTSCRLVHTTPEQFVMAFGAGGDPRKVQWCDRGDRTSWTPSALNQAGDFTMNIDGFVRQVVTAKDQILILTTDSIWRCVYVGYPEVYEFTRVAQISVISGRSAVTVDDSVYWVSQGGFHRSDGGFVQDLPSPVEDWMFDQMNDVSGHRIFGWHHDQFNEIVWHFVTGDYDDPADKFVAYNYAEDHWSVGDLNFSVVLPRGVLKYPVGIGGQLPRGSSRIGNHGFFTTDACWVAGTNWSVTTSGGGTASQSSPTASDLTLDISCGSWETNGSLVDGAYYRLAVTASTPATGGELTIGFGDLTGDKSMTFGTDSQKEGCIRFSSGEDFVIRADGTWDGVLSICNLINPPGIHYIDIWDQTNAQSFYETEPYIESGPLDLENGERRVHVHQLYPDAEASGDLTFTFKTKEYPNGSETTHGPYTASEPTDVRFSGRQFKMQVKGPVTGPGNNPPEDFRSGTHRLDITLGGKR